MAFPQLADDRSPCIPQVNEYPTVRPRRADSASNAPATSRPTAIASNLAPKAALASAGTSARSPRCSSSYISSRSRNAADSSSFMAMVFAC